MPNDVAWGDGAKKNLSEMTLESNLKWNQTQKGTCS